MEKLNVDYLGGRSFEASVRNHKIIIDLPHDSKGKDAGPTPPEFFVMSLASCVGIYLVFYCEKANLDTAGLKVEVDYEKLPDRIGKIYLEFSLPSAKTAKERAEALAWAEKCFVHNTIRRQPEIKIIQK